jgi:Right handed beta helix region
MGWLLGEGQGDTAPSRARALRPADSTVWLLVPALAFVLLAGLSLPGASSAAGKAASPNRPKAVCSRVASPVGSDRANGSRRSPYRSLRRLMESLRPGMVGCLRRGNYGSQSTFNDFERSGTSSARITLRNYPGERATVRGYTAIDGSYVTFAHLKIDNTNTVRFGHSCGGRYESLTLAGSNIVLDHNVITASDLSHSANGMYVTGDNETIRFNKIHHVGACQRFDHGIYVATSHNFNIEFNWIYDCRAGWGIQLFPNATNGRIRHNTIDGCGAGITISGSGDKTSRDNKIDHNLITNSVGFPTNKGTAIAGCCSDSPYGNLVTGNIFWRNAGGSFDNSVGRSYVARDNVSANPRYVNRVAKDFRVRAYRAKALGLWDGGAGQRR